MVVEIKKIHEEDKVFSEIGNCIKLFINESEIAVLEKRGNRL